MRKLKVFYGAFFFFLLAFLQPLSAQSYTVTEEQLQQIEQHQQAILEEAENLKAQLEQLETKSAQELAELNKQLQEQSESLRKYEKKAALIRKYGAPIFCAFSISLFCGGFIVGTRAAIEKN